ncbi:hypothetical protein D9615_001604 [Tricholomella constricta]|uniref:Uncharacterized protein n=1 Tax=Tricholomella constricta TaxID=117010 RepID=A0A8H5MAS6_9AGAR|nr:hypothetical protein D9615_001604 [Tricholomella constricta]
MLLLPIILLAAEFSGITALPLAARHDSSSRGIKSKGGNAVTKALAAAPAAANATEIGQFGQVIQLGGGNVKTDVVFTKSAVGSFEVEFQDVNANTLTVTENKNPPRPPTGFTALEPSSFKIALAKGANNLTLQKVDYIIDAASDAVKGIDFSKGKIGKLCTETNTFVIDDALGELEFEADENELTLTVKNMIGEWGIFVPTAAAVGGVAEKKNEIEIVGAFDTAIAISGSNQKTDIFFPESAAGKLEVEVDANAPNTITVKQNTSPVAPPAGFLFVDPTTYQIATVSKTNPAIDVVKVDYIFSAAVLAAVDVKQGVIGKLDTATNTFVTDPKLLNAEFEFEAEENEWTLTVPDLNGEWAILIPEAALLPRTRRSLAL